MRTIGSPCGQGVTGISQYIVRSRQVPAMHAKPYVLPWPEAPQLGAA